MITNHPYSKTTTVYSPFESLVGQMLCDPPVCTSGLPGATDSKESACKVSKQNSHTRQSLVNFPCAKGTESHTHTHTHTHTHIHQVPTGLQTSDPHAFLCQFNPRILHRIAVDLPCLSSEQAQRLGCARELQKDHPGSLNLLHLLR